MTDNYLNRIKDLIISRQFKRALEEITLSPLHTEYGDVANEHLNKLQQHEIDSQNQVLYLDYQNIVENFLRNFYKKAIQNTLHEVKENLGNAKLESGIKLLINIAPSEEIEDDLQAQLTRFKKYQRDKAEGGESYETLQRTWARISHAVQMYYKEIRFHYRNNSFVIEKSEFQKLNHHPEKPQVTTNKNDSQSQQNTRHLNQKKTTLFIKQHKKIIIFTISLLLCAPIYFLIPNSDSNQETVPSTPLVDKYWTSFDLIADNANLRACLGFLTDQKAVGRILFVDQNIQE